MSEYVYELTQEQKDQDRVRMATTLGVDLYSDPTHFVFELLQNAEDAKATEIEFAIYPDRLEIKHNGKIFDQKDITSIIRCCASTKPSDPDTHGRFGVGFKSVFSITDCPKIHSGDSCHFEIPVLLQDGREINKILISSPFTTLFVLPFRKDKDYHSLLLKRFATLDVRTILFLFNIQRIKWLDTCTETYKEYTKKTSLYNQTNFHKVVVSSGDQSENWLMFSSKDHVQKFRVNLAFLLTKDKQTNQDKIIAIKDNHFYILFPTKTSVDTGFIIDANFDPTESRENVKENDFNQRLLQFIANSITTCLIELRKIGLYDINILNALPIQKDKFFKKEDSQILYRPSTYTPTFYSVLYKTILQFLQAKKFLPLKNGGYGKLDSNTILLKNTKLLELFNKNAPIVDTKITKDGAFSKLYDYLLLEGIHAVDTEEYISNLTIDDTTNKPISWFITLYSLLNSNSSLYTIDQHNRKKGCVWDSPIIKLESGQVAKPREEIFLPSSLHTDKFKIVSKHIFRNDEAKKFIEALGIKKPNYVDYIKSSILPQYETPKKCTDVEKYKEDITVIINTFKSPEISDSEKNKLKKLLKQSYIVLTTCCNLKLPSKTFINTNNLHNYFNDIENDVFVTQDFSNTDWEILGVNTTLPIIITLNGNKKQYHSDYYLYLDFDKDLPFSISVDNALDFAQRIIEVYRKDFSNTCQQEIKFLREKEEGGLSRHFFDTQLPFTLFSGWHVFHNKNYCNETYESPIVSKLKSMKWVLNADGELCCPTSISKTELHPTMSFLSELPNEIFKDKDLDDAIKKVTESGFRILDPEDYEKFQAWKQKQKGKEEAEQEEIELPQIEYVLDISGEHTDMRREQPEVINKSCLETSLTHERIKTDKESTDISKIAKIDGNRGEEAVIIYLQHNEGIDKECIVHNNTDATTAVGHDIKIIRDGELERYIEVKSTMNSCSSTNKFKITGPQWNNALKYGDRYWLYVVFNVQSAHPSVHRIQNPVSQWLKGSEEIEIGDTTIIVKPLTDVS